MNLILIFSKLMRLIGEKRYGTVKAFLLNLANRSPILGRVFKKKLAEMWAKDGQIQFTLNLMSGGADEARAFLNSLTVNELADRNSILIAMFRTHLQNSLDPSKKTVALYLVGPGYTENLGAIPDGLRRKGYNVLGLVGRSPEQVAELYREARKKVKVDACICVGLIEGMPEDTTVIYFVHDIHDSALTNIQKIHRLIPKCNFIFVPNEPALNRYREKVLEGRKKFYKHGNTPEVCFIRGGYPKLDSNIRYLQEHNEPPMAIIYATTVVEDIGDIVSLPKHACQIIESILTEIPDRVLIFRPHPGTIGSKEVAAIAQKYRIHPRFILDSNPSFYMENYAKSALMISDMSGTAFTYAFTTLRPVVFFSHNESEVKKRFGSYQYFIDRYKVGDVVTNVDDLLEKVRQIIRNANSCSECIMEYRNSFMYNVGYSENYFVDNFEYIIENKKHPEWVYI